MSWAARLTDATDHGGVVTATQAMVLICGLPASRQNDPHICPQHGGGVVNLGSVTVQIGNVGAARKGDLCLCLSVGVSGTGVPGQVSPGQVEAVGGSEAWKAGEMGSTSTPIPGVKLTTKATYRLGDGQISSSDHDGDGTVDTVSGKGSLAHGEAGHRADFFGFYHEGSVEGELGYGEVSESIHVDIDRTYWKSKRSGEAGVFSLTDRTAWGYGGQKIYERESQLHLGRVCGDGEFTVGDNGQDVGFQGGSSGGADLIQAQDRRRVHIGDLEAELGLESGYGVGCALQQHLHYDRVEDKIQIGGHVGGFPAGLGISINLKIPVPDFISGGPEGSGGGGASGDGPSPGSGGMPNTIVTGCPSVLIGD